MVDLLPVRPGPLKCKHTHGANEGGLSRKWTRLTARDPEEEDYTDSVLLDLDDLPVFPHSRAPVFDLEFKQKLPETASTRQTTLSAPCRIFDPPPPDTEPPISIHWDAFTVKVDEQIAAASATTIGDIIRTVTIQQPS